MGSLESGLALAVVATVAVSIAVVRRLEGSGARWGDVLRARLILGVPWGALVTVGVVLSVYLFVQDGISQWHNPVTLPYRAWSYLYPLGMVTAPFSHASSGHLIGNLVGTVVIGSIAEYAWGHYPTERGAQSFSRVRTNPWVRAFVLFPLAVVFIGLLTSVFAIGPVIGFSGVVYAFAGFAIVRYPIATIVGAIGVQGAAATTYRALQVPIVISEAQPSPPAPPWWANIAIQGHALGLFIGVLLAVAVVRRRSYRPSPARLWAALLLYGFAQSLWAIYWFRGSDTYVLYRGPGVVVVTALALVVTVAVTGSERSILPAAIERRISRRKASASVERIAELGLSSAKSGARRASRLRTLALGRQSESSTMPTRRGAAFTIVLLVLAITSGPAVPVNLFTVDDPETGTESIAVEDYTVTYAENVENDMISIVDVSAFGETTSVEASGVIVSSRERNIWTETVSKRQLAFRGRSTVDVGGPGWRGSVTALRRGWSATGGGTAYQVWLRPEDGDWRLAHTSEPVRADVTVDDRNVSIVPEEGQFYLEVRRVDTNESERVAIPGDGETLEADGIRFVREGRGIYAESDGTRVRVASRERYG